jgi:hypothetical protein
MVHFLYSEEGEKLGKPNLPPGNIGKRDRINKPHGVKSEKITVTWCIDR